MKKIILVSILLLGISSYAQNGLTRLLAAGQEDANTFADSFLSPGNDAVALGLSNGWFNSAKAKQLGGFEVSIIGSASLVGDDQQEFRLNESDYNLLEFQNGPSSQMVGNALGENNPDVGVKAVFESNGFSEEVPFDLPQGLADSNINFVPGAMIQGSVGLISGFEIKGRYLPEVKSNDVDVRLYGIGLKHEFTDWLPFDELFPLHISGFIGYTKFDGSLKVENNFIVNSTQQRIDSEMESWNYAALVSTKLPVINFYGSIGYINATSSSDLIGTYQINEGPLAGQSIEDPISISSDASSVQGTLGFKLKLAFFKINGQYSFQKYDTVSLGLNFGI